MLALDAQTVVDLPVDELAMRVLADLVQSDQRNEHSYMNEIQQLTPLGQNAAAMKAVAEAFGWLRSRVLISRSPADDANVIFVTRAGIAALAEGLPRVRAEQRLQEGLHPLIEQRARRQFLVSEYEQAIFVAMKAVEVRVRELSGYGDEHYGVKMMRKAFGSTGPLTDHDAPDSEQDGTRFLFEGAYSVLRNPSGHRDVDYDDLAEAAEAVTVASLLMRILDRVERRLGTGNAPPV